MVTNQGLATLLDTLRTWAGNATNRELMRAIDVLSDELTGRFKPDDVELAYTLLLRATSVVVTHYIS